jgi:two-component system chemotaxis response regulator CheY
MRAKRTANSPKIKIVIVEDETDMREIAKSIISKSVVSEVFTTDNGPEAVKLVKKHQPALVLQDLKIKGSMTGWDCVRKIREFNDQVKIIIMTANLATEKPDTNMIKHHAISDIIVKPFGAEYLKNKVNEILKRDNAYKKYVLDTQADVSIKGSPEAREMIHAINTLLACLKIKCEYYWLHYHAANLIKDVSQEDLLKIFEQLQDDHKKVLEILLQASKDVDEITQEVEKIRFLK